MHHTRYPSINSTMPMTISMELITIGILLIPLIISAFVYASHEVYHHFTPLKYEQYHTKRIHIVDSDTQSPHMITITDQDNACYTICPMVWDNIQLELADIQPGDAFTTIKYNTKHEIMHITSHISRAKYEKYEK